MSGEKQSSNGGYQAISHTGTGGQVFRALVNGTGRKVIGVRMTGKIGTSGNSPVKARMRLHGSIGTHWTSEHRTPSWGERKAMSHKAVREAVTSSLPSPLRMFDSSRTTLAIC